MRLLLESDDPDAPDKADPAAAWAKRTPGQRKVQEGQKWRSEYK